MPRGNQNYSQGTDGFDEKVIQVSRVTKKTKGGNKIGFSVLMVVGDKKGSVGVGLGKAQDVLSAIKKGVKKAKKKMIKIPLDGTTIPFPLRVKQGASQIIFRPSPKGSGVIAGGPVRAVVEAAGIRDVTAKILGTGNQASNAYATFEALKQISQIVKVKGLKLMSIADSEAEEETKLKELQEKHQKRAEGEAAPKKGEVSKKPATPPKADAPNKSATKPKKVTKTKETNTKVAAKPAK